ncbi:MAG TPA: TetR/AcrR family transcriptional regulator [Micromonosporaceae bacterium]|nr:TetR/AcrR family transcriptional regulator [Micromonosporaceae bacterium]
MRRMTPTAIGAARPPGRPRSVRADEAIIEAMLDLLAEGTPVDALSIEAVAARAGVGKATIYRRWANKDALLLDAIRALKGVPPQPAGVSLRDDLVALVGSINRSQDRRALRVMPCLVPEVHRNPEHYRIFQEMIEQRRDVMRGVLRRGVESGELRADLDVELALTLLTAPMLVQKVLRWHPGLDEATLPEQVVDAVLRGITA